ncbi:MAG: hypothetical protein R3338_02415, partial [Thermoanaerobaculia bacterium]|nr:hypothetical protein [Thermoanaerobaculia bacterium]
SDDGAGIHAVLGAEEISSLGSDAPLALDSADGYKFSSAISGKWDEPERGAAAHGHDPRRPAVHASFLFRGPAGLCGNLGVISMTEIAPTLGEFLGIELDSRASSSLRSSPPCPDSEKESLIR